MTIYAEIARKIATENAGRDYWSYATYSRFMRVCRKGGLNPASIVKAVA